MHITWRFVQIYQYDDNDDDDDRVHSFGMTQKRIIDPRSLGLLCITGTDEPSLRKRILQFL